MVITLNIPKMPSEEGSGGVDEIDHDENGVLRLGKAAQEGQRIMEDVWRTFEIKDWGLFGVE